MCPSDRIVQAADVEALRGTEPGASVFDLMNAIGAHDHGRALRILARNVENGEAPLRILGALVWQYRRLWKTKEQLRSGGREGEAARTLRMDPARVRGFLEQFSDAQLVQAFQWFMETDSKLKGGSGSTPLRVMEDLLFRLCGQPSKQVPADGTGSDDDTGPAPGRFETGVEYQNGYAEAVMAFTRTVSLDTRREAVLGFSTPLVTALPSAAVASRRWLSLRPASWQRWLPGLSEGRFGRN